MKRTFFIIAFAALVLSFGLSYGQPIEGEMSLDHVDGIFNWGTPSVPVGDTIAANTPITFYIRWNTTVAYKVIGHSLGFRVYSPEGASWSPITTLPWVDMVPLPPVYYPYYIGNPLDPDDDWNDFWDTSCDVNPYSITGTGADTVGFAGAKKYLGIDPGFNEIVFTISTEVSDTEAGDQLCLDSTWYRPSNNWVWSTEAPDYLGDRIPSWTGPHCFRIYDVPNLKPVISDCPMTTPTAHHCAEFGHAVDLNASDPDDVPAYPLAWYVTGYGTITEGGGDNLEAQWHYNPVLADVPNPAAGAVTIWVEDDLGMASDDCVFTPTYLNDAPIFAGGCYLEIPASAGDLINHTLLGDMVDCDPYTFNFVGITPTPVTAVPSIVVGPGPDFNGLISWQTDPLDYDPAGTTTQTEQLYTATFEITDTKGSNQCTVDFLVVKGGKIKVQIDLDCDPEDMAFQGQHRLIDVMLMKTSGIDIGGFDILIAYDASALSFQSAIEGPAFYAGDALAEPPIDGCGWEYFTYRYGPYGNCGNACPSGMLRVVGIAETNNGDVHPTCGTPDPLPATMFTLDFLISNDRTLECSFIPISFFWMDCGDNSLSSFDGNTLYISAAVITAMTDVITGQPTDIANPLVGYPTYLGAQDADCFVGDTLKVPVRTVDFVNGGICIPCADSIDARGDVNLNEIPYEIADAVVFSNYFVLGISAFHGNVEGQIAATDVNADGVALSVADLVYLIRVVVGDAMPYDKLNPLHAGYTVSANGTISVDAEVGAAFVVAEGNVVPTLLADNMDMRYAFDGANTRILVYSMEVGNTFAGEFVTTNSNVVSVEMATYEGAPIVSKLDLPDAYALHQNYPNPFNPGTVISFSLPHASDYTLTIYNVTGQQVASFAGTAEAGEHSVEWMADREASGIYFYKLDAADFTATKKMILLK